MDNNFDVSEVLPNLWIGSYKAAISNSFIIKYNIKYIINLTDDIPNYFKEKITYLNQPLFDKDVCYNDLTDKFDVMSQFIYRALHEKTGILVHCKNGQHVSASVIAAFLIKYIKLDYVASIIYINSIRKHALTKNTCMLNSVFKYYAKLNK
jgi:hypothetical protein